MINKKIIILVLCLAVMTVISGCGKKEVKMIIEDNKQEVNQEQNNEKKVEEQKEKKEDIEKIPTSTDEIDISDWQTFNEQDINFIFEYPKKWTYSVKNYRINAKKIIFNSKIRENEMMIHIPMPAIGLEPFGPVEKKIYKTNDANTDLLLTYMKSADKTYKKNMIILQWQTGVKGNKLKDEFKQWDNSIAILISIIGYDEKYDKYYRNIMEKIANSLKFIN